MSEGCPPAQQAPALAPRTPPTPVQSVQSFLAHYAATGQIPALTTTALPDQATAGQQNTLPRQTGGSLQVPPRRPNNKRAAEKEDKPQNTPKQQPSKRQKTTPTPPPVDPEASPNPFQRHTGTVIHISEGSQDLKISIFCRAFFTVALIANEMDGDIHRDVLPVLRKWLKVTFIFGGVGENGRLKAADVRLRDEED